MRHTNTSPPTEPRECYVTAAEIGEHYSVTGRHVLNLASRKIIPSIRLGKSIRFLLEDVAVALENHSQQQIDQLLPAVSSGAEEEEPNVSD